MEEQSIKPIPVEFVAHKILLIRGQKVILDSDLAEFYQVATKALNRAVKRNIQRFPLDFMFQLSKEEAEEKFSLVKRNLKYQIGTSSWGGKRKLPYAFTEHGVLMLASVLRSQKAAEISIFIVRAFVRIREILSSNKELAYKVQELEHEQKLQNKYINNLYSMFNKILDKSLKPPGPMGFGISGG